MILEIFQYGLALGSLIWLGNLFAPWFAWSTRESLNALDSEPLNEEHQADLTVLIPARDEEEVIEETLQGVMTQGSQLPILLVDDHSSDQTQTRARNVAGPQIQIIEAPPLPAGWSGKLGALEYGRKQVESKYLLVIDADIRLKPGILKSLFEKMEKENLDFVSLMAELSFRNFWEKLLMPAYVYFFKLLYPFRLANSKYKAFSSAAGGCILMRREALEKIGGYERIREALIDDCNLAKAFKQDGFRTWVGLTRSVTSHREYSGLNQIWNLVARSAFTYLRYSKSLLMVCSIAMIAAFWILPLGLIVFPADSLWFGVSALGLLCMFVAYAPLVLYYRLNPIWILSLPLSGSLYFAMTWSSAIRYWGGKRSQWKGRIYTKDLSSKT